MKAGGDKDGIWTILESGLQYVTEPSASSLCISVHFLASAQLWRMSHTSSDYGVRNGRRCRGDEANHGLWPTKRVKTVGGWRQQ
jgi:hypothetical protein